MILLICFIKWNIRTSLVILFFQKKKIVPELAKMCYAI